MTTMITPAEMDELRTQAVAMNRNRRAILEQASDGALRHLLDTAPAHELAASGLTVESLWNELHRRNKALPGAPKVVCAVVCGVTGTTECPTDPVAQAGCPTC
jgi:hypothetical protein